MDFLTAYVTLVTSFLENSVKLGWPIAAAWVAWLFRDAIKAKLASLKGMNGYGMNLDFDHRMEVFVEKARYIAEPTGFTDMPAEPPIKSAPPQEVCQTEPENLPVLARSHAISSAFSDLVSELRRVAGPYGYTRSGQKRLVETMLGILLKRNKIPRDLASQIAELRALRNVAVSNPESIGVDEFAAYIEYAVGAVEELQKLEPVK